MKSGDIVVGLTLVTCAFATIFPPYTFELVGYNGARLRDGLEWGFIFSPPTYYGRFYKLPAIPVIAWSTLIAEYLAISFFALAAILATRKLAIGRKASEPIASIKVESTNVSGESKKWALGKYTTVIGVILPIVYLAALSGAILLREYGMLPKPASIDVVSAAYLVVAISAVAPIIRSYRESMASRTKKASYIGILLISGLLTSSLALGFLMGP